MPHPKKRTSKTARNQRRSHHSLKEIFILACEKCGSPIKPHHACLSCGFYNGKNVLEKKEVEVKKASVAKPKETKTEDAK